MKNYINVQMVVEFFGVLGKNQLILCSPDFTIFLMQIINHFDYISLPVDSFPNKENKLTGGVPSGDILLSTE